MIKELEKQEEGSLAMVAIDETAIKACRENNKEKLGDESSDPEVGGNLRKYKQLLGS